VSRSRAEGLRAGEDG